jgi:hypothetical protein
MLNCSVGAPDRATEDEWRARMRRWILPALLVIGFPTWMWYWIQNPYVLVYMYAYAMATVVSAWWADGLLKRS